MAIPDYQSLMLPLLQILADGKEHPNLEVLDALADQFNLTDEERKQLLPSGQDFLFRNRVGWAKAHMKAAGLINNPKRGIFVITKTGRELIDSNPDRIDLKLLQTYEAYRESQKKWHKPKANVPEIQSEGDQDTKTPEERIEGAYVILRESVASQIVEHLKACSANFFEKVVVEVLVKMGYGGSRKDAGEAIGKSGDEGIDGIIKEDRLGLDIIYIQAKKWDNTISRSEIQKFAGALQGKRAKKGIFITTSDFSKTAYEYVSAIDSKIILIDGQQLAMFMMDFNVGVATEAVYELKRIDSDYFVEA
ncbi:restriction endonuclease [Candidatus Parcubacteria bacterium]|nr:MAG: restriction endonuclease [Candidatus Parcubacteria bacterium]